MISPLFYIFAAIMLIGGTMVVTMRNPVSSALAMVSSFVGLAALFIGLNSYLIGVLQILVYAGAIMVLFIFIIMLLDLQEEEKRTFSSGAIAAGVAIPLIIIVQLIGVINKDDSPSSMPPLDFKEAVAKYSNEDTMIHKKLSEGRLPDTHLIGDKLYTEYNFPIQMIAVLLLVATVGCVTLSKKNATSAPDPTVPSDASKAWLAQEPKLKSSLETKPKPEPKVRPESAEPESKPVASHLTDNPTQQNITTTDEKRGLIYHAAPPEIDDLKVISGVGPVLENKLNDFGIYTYKQIADWSDDNISEFDNLLSFKGRITRDNWLTQASELHAKKNA